MYDLCIYVISHVQKRRFMQSACFVIFVMFGN